MNSRAAIRDIVMADWERPAPESVFDVGERLRQRHGASVGAVLFYGSCLRSGSDRDSLLDLYLLVDSYGDCYPGRPVAALANRLLPPNVFYYECGWRGRTVRAKYAVISFEDFAAAARPSAILPAIWARFSQPTVLAYAREEETRERVLSALVDAIATMALRTAPLIGSPVSAVEFWTCGYARSYRAESRVEGEGRARQLVEPRSRYERLLRPALSAAGVPFAEAGEGRIVVELGPAERRQGKARWSRASLATQLHTIPRLAKAALTFEGGVDYALWKVERHSGVRVEAGPWQRRHPILAALPLLWRAYRRGAFRRA
ncbi:MAG TPA: hypothetical protein VNB28_09775 [Methylomirabilota bacterium]|nr:hypothetical protein [Methylomirabilota bacterium]